MKVRLEVQISGTRNGVDWPAPGDVIDLPTGEAESLIASGQAAASKSAAAPIEVAVTAGLETAVAKPRRK